VDNLMHLSWQHAVNDLRAARDPLEAEFFAAQPSIEREALDLHKRDQRRASRYLTDLTRARMERVVQTYRELRGTLVAKYPNSTY